MRSACENPYSLPEPIIAFQRVRGIQDYKCDNQGLLSNWREACANCSPDTVSRLLGQAAIEAAGRRAPCKDLRACLGLGLDPVAVVGLTRSGAQHDLIQGMTLGIRDVTVLAEIVLAVPVAELGNLVQEGYLPRFFDSVPDVAVCVSKNSVAFEKNMSLLEYVLSRECETDRMKAALGMLDLDSEAIQDGVGRAIQYAIDETAANSKIDDQAPRFPLASSDAVFKLAALLCASEDLHGYGLRNPGDGHSTLLHAFAKEGTTNIINDQVIVRGGVEEKLFYQAIGRMTSPDPASGVAPFDVNARDEKGRTPLFYAFKNDHLELCSRLLAAGADLETKDDFGVSINDLAKQRDANNGDDAMERMLLEWRASNARLAIDRVLRSNRGSRP